MGCWDCRLNTDLMDTLNQNQQQAKQSGDKRILLAVIFVVLVVLALGVFVAFKAQSKSNLSSEGVTLPSPNAPLASVVPAPEAKRAEIKAYLSQAASGSYQEEYLDRIPESAVVAYVAFRDEKDPNKRLDTARNFYVIMNIPSNFNDPGFVAMVQAVRADLEKQLGRTLF